MREQLEEARRAGKRQAAPFSKGDPKKDPARPGRKSGEDYGTRAHRPVPDHVDEEIRVPLPDACPCCSGELEFEDEVDQYQEEIVEVRGHVRRFRISRGRCRRCGRRAQGRHPDQTSDAIGAAGSQLGPRAVAIAAQLNKELGVAMGKVCQILALFGLQVTPGGLYQAIGRLATAAEPTREALVLAVRHSAAVAADETGWRVGRVAAVAVGVRRRRRRHRLPDRPRPRLRAGRRRPRRAASPACWSATGGRPTGASPTPSTRPALRTCCAAPAS